MVIILKTGGGKSLLWMIPLLLGLNGISVVICPFKTLMEEQYAWCVKAGVRCHNYGWSKEVSESVQNLFVQVEHIGCDAFQRHVFQTFYNAAIAQTNSSLSLLVQPIGKRIQKIFINEFHNVIQCHPGQKDKWNTLGMQCSQLPAQIILLSATCPPSMAETLLKPFML